MLVRCWPIRSCSWPCWSLDFDWPRPESNWCSSWSDFQGAIHLVSALLPFHNFMSLMGLLRIPHHFIYSGRLTTSSSFGVIRTWDRKLVKVWIDPWIIRTCYNWSCGCNPVFEILVLNFNINFGFLLIFWNCFSNWVYKIFFILLQGCHKWRIMPSVHCSHLPLQLFNRCSMFLYSLVLHMELFIHNFSDLLWCPLDIKNVPLCDTVL